MGVSNVHSSQGHTFNLGDDFAQDQYNLASGNTFAGISVSSNGNLEWVQPKEGATTLKSYYINSRWTIEKSSGAVLGGIPLYGFIDTYQPYTVVNYWHRTA